MLKPRNLRREEGFVIFANPAALGNKIRPQYPNAFDRPKVAHSNPTASEQSEGPHHFDRSFMAWTYLVLAGLFEIGWAVGLKYTEGFTRLWPSLWTGASMAASVFLLAKALRDLPVGTGYAVWTGIGAAGTAVLGMVLFGESREVLRLLCIALIVSGVVGLKLFSS